jgi:gas vesicle protein
MSKNGSNLLLGIVTGTVLGILFAPKKGKELREEIKKERKKGGVGFDTIKEGFISMGQEMAGSAKTVYEMEEVQRGLDKAKDFASGLIEEGKQKVEKVAKKASKKVVKKAKKVAKEASKKATKFTKNRIAKK